MTQKLTPHIVVAERRFDGGVVHAGAGSNPWTAGDGT